MTTTKDVQAGRASALAVKPKGNRRQAPPPPEKGSPTTTAQRARAAVVAMAKAHGISAEVEPTRDVTQPHVHIDSKRPRVFAKVKVMQSKFQIRDHLYEVSGFARLVGEDVLPVLFHKHNAIPMVAIIDAEQFFRLLKLANR